MAVVAVSAAATLGAGVLYAFASKQAGVDRGSALENVSIGARFIVTAPESGEVTDGGLILSLKTAQAVTLSKVELVGERPSSGLRLVNARILPLNPDQNQAVGVRPGPLSALSLDGAVSSLPMQIPGAAAAAVNEVLLGLSVPSGSGLWNITGVKISYWQGAAEEYQIFAHNLTICGPANPSCQTADTVDVAAPSTSGLNRLTCASGTRSWVSGEPVAAWLATNVHSTWVGSGGTIELSTSQAASFTTTSSSSYSVGVQVSLTSGLWDGFGFDEIDLSLSAMRTWGVSIAHAATSTQAWNYTITVSPNSPVERLTVYIRGWVLPTTTVTTGSDCAAAYTYGAVYAPVEPATSGDYCIALDITPGIADLGSSCHVL